jgi:SAM-dependent methyltransferase
VSEPDSPYHQTRFTYEPGREVLWKTLCNAYFNKLIQPSDHVLELGAGYCHFINNVRCAQRTAVDQFPSFGKYARPGVDVRVGSVADLDFLADQSVDFVFASNLFEHLTQQDLAVVLAQLRQKLRSSGTLNILQPNYRRCHREYFDDYTHVSVYSDVSLCDFLEANRYQVLECRAGFLPLSIKSRLPISPALIRLYLLSPWKPLAKQMLIRAQPAPP